MSHLDRNLRTKIPEVNLSSFSFLFSEIVRYSHNRVASVADLEKKLSDIGKRVGIRTLELLTLRDRGSRREIKLNGILVFVHTVVWKALFGKPADFLEKDGDKDDTYMISDREMVVNKYISVTSDMGFLNCGAFVAGIVEAILEASNFPATVSAHSVEQKGTTILIKFDTAVLPPEALESR